MANIISEISFTILTTFVIIVLLIFYFKILNKFSQKQTDYKASLELLQLEHEKNIFQTQLDIQELTFEKISRDIHDNISPTLTLAKLNINTYLMSKTHLDFTRLYSAVDLIGRTLLDLNNISRSLNADIIGHYGLIKAVEMEMDKLNQLEQCTFKLEIDQYPTSTSKEIELELFRIIQESCNNILKHADAQLATVAMKGIDEGVNLTIADNGKGFDQCTLENQVAIRPRSGLKNIRSRAEMINGEADISSYPGKGTIINIIIPFNHDERNH